MNGERVGDNRIQTIISRKRYLTAIGSSHISSIAVFIAGHLIPQFVKVWSGRDKWVIVVVNAFSLVKDFIKKSYLSDLWLCQLQRLTSSHAPQLLMRDGSSVAQTFRNAPTNTFLMAMGQLAMKCQKEEQYFGEPASPRHTLSCSSSSSASLTKTENVYAQPTTLKRSVASIR